MAHVKINLSLEESVAAAMRQLASEDGTPISQYLARLIREDQRRREDELAEEGYRLMAEESLAFARSIEPLWNEVFPVWEED